MLAAGYATQPSPLTDSIPSVCHAGRPMLDYLLDRLEAVDEIDVIHVVTNACAAGDFGGGPRNGPGLRRSRSGTTGRRATRIGSVQSATSASRSRRAPRARSFVAGDNLIEYSLEDFVRFMEKGHVSDRGAPRRIPS